MKILENKPPREFQVGEDSPVTLRDCATITLAPDEMVTFRMLDGSRYDVVAKTWGFYATPSVNARLRDEGFKTALVRNVRGRYYIMLVSLKQKTEFERYIATDKSQIIEWLDERSAGH